MSNSLCRSSELVPTSLALIGVARAATESLPATAPDVMAEAKRLLSDRVAAVIDLQELAEDLGMSYARFRRQFKERFGIAPYQHRLLAKLNHARELLMTTDLSIGTAAELLGFNDPFHFSRLFKRKFGVAPSEVRKGKPKQRPR